MARRAAWFLQPWVWSAVAALLWLIGAASPAGAQRPVTADEINAVASGMYCPVCESEPLDTCGTQACQDWREEIGVQLAAGRTREEIYADFRARYGDRVLAEPPAEGFNLLLWLGLPALLIVAAVWFGRYLRTLTTAAPPAPTRPARTHDDPYRRRIEEELLK